MTIERFALPRLDWYDEEGRIYKDALIENFNALEAKLNEINALSAFSAEVPDISNLHLDDVTLASEDNKVVNLRSFLNIFGLINYPIEIRFDGLKLGRLAYWNEDYDYIEKENIATGASNTKKFITYNFETETVTSKEAIESLGESEIVLGYVVDGKVITLTSAYVARLNLMYLLSNMAKNTQRFFVGTGYKNDNIYFSDKQQAAIIHCEKKAGKYNNTMTFLEEGRKDG